jgi:hypothetical protein
MEHEPTLVAEADPQKAKTLPNHIVISAELVNAEMLPAQLEKVCQSLVDTFFHCLVTKRKAGIYLPYQDSEIANKAPNPPTTSDEDENEKQKLIRQSGGKQAIVKSILYHLDNDFLPFLMHAVDTMPKEQEEQEQPETNNNNKDITKNKKNSMPEVGCVFNRRGEMISMGSLSTCGTGVAGIFMNGVY